MKKSALQRRSEIAWTGAAVRAMHKAAVQALQLERRPFSLPAGE
jgi:hypothetical protein